MDSTTIKEENKLSDHFEALFDHVTMGILITDSHGKIVMINPFALTEFGYKLEELIGSKIEILIPGRFHHHHEERVGDFFNKPHNRPMGLGMDLVGLKKDGEEFPVEASLGHYVINGEKFAIAVVSKISVRKQSEAEIIKLKNELEAIVEHRTELLTNTMHELERNKEVLSKALEKETELSELKSWFVSMASHEFRTPLTTVLSSAYLIKKYVTTEDQFRREKHLTRIVSSINMLTGILNDFLSLGKIEEGKIQVRLSEFNVNDCISSTIEELQENLKKDQHIEFKHDGALIALMDASLFKHIVLNLISNASKFSPESSVIEITSDIQSSIYTLSVKDHGMGISKDDQQHLMERFFRGSNVANIQGTGLGLHIISKYASLMNGFVECRSEINKGTEFILTFNLNANEDAKDFID